MLDDDPTIPVVQLDPTLSLVTNPCALTTPVPYAVFMGITQITVPISPITEQLSLR